MLRLGYEKLEIYHNLRESMCRRLVYGGRRWGERFGLSLRSMHGRVFLSLDWSYTVLVMDCSYVFGIFFFAMLGSTIRRIIVVVAAVERRLRD